MNIWHPYTQEALDGPPIKIDRGDGAWLYTTDGRRLLDGISSWWVNIHGHAHPLIAEAIAKQARKLEQVIFAGFTHEAAEELSERLGAIVPQSLSRLFFSDNGSTAVEVALKIAVQYWHNMGRPEKKRIVALENAYHGDTIGAMSVSADSAFTAPFESLRFTVLRARGIEGLREILSKNRGQIAALIVEPLIQGAAGMVLMPKGVLRKFRDLCKKYDVIFIADEVATGFGRTGKMFACEHEGVSPDIMCLAKGLTGGYLPLAATLTTKRIFDGFLFDYKDQKTFFHGHTYTGNPLACAAALANLEVFERERVLPRLEAKIKHLSKRLQLFYNLKSVGDVRQLGFMAGIELMKDRAKDVPFDWKEKVGIRVCQKVRERGVILRPLGNVIVLMPPLSISMAELGKLLDATYWTIREEV